MSGQIGRAANARAVLACVATLLLFDAAFNLARGSTLPPRYWLAIGGLSLALAAAAGLLTALPGWRPEAALALWIGLEGLAWCEGGPARRLLVGAGFGLLAWALPGLRPRPRGGPLTPAIVAACGFSLATLVWPRLGNALGLGLRQGAAGDLATLAVFGAVLATLSLWPRLAPGRRLAAGPMAAVAVMLLCLAGTRLAYDRARPERAAAAPGPAAAAGPDGPSILVLVLDTVRADALTPYGAAADTTPRLSRFVETAGRVMVYPWAFAPSNWTIPSHASLLTGLPPSEHGAHEGAGGLRGSPFKVIEMHAGRTLAEVLAARGYRTALLTANPTLLRVRGIERGFDLVRQPPPPRPSTLLAERLRRGLAPSLMAGEVGETPKASRMAAELLDFVAGGEAPFFAVVNFMEAHTPYTPPWSEAGMFTGGRALRGPSEALASDPAERVELARGRYLEEVRALDRQLGALLDELAAGGLLDRAWLAVTSDHGEAFLEHGSTNHGGDVYNEQVRVPLIVRPPRGAGPLPPVAPVGLLDLATTLAAAGGAAGFGRGRDLTAAAAAPVIVEFYGDRHGGRRYSPRGDQPAAAVVVGELKMIRRGGREELFDLARDPHERRDRLAELPAAAARLRPLVPALQLDEASARAAEQELSYEELEALRALGYLD